MGRGDGPGAWGPKKRGGGGKRVEALKSWASF